MKFQHVISEALLTKKWDTWGEVLFEQWNESMSRTQETNMTL